LPEPPNPAGIVTGLRVNVPATVWIGVSLAYAAVVYPPTSLAAWLGGVISISKSVSYAPETGTKLEVTVNESTLPDSAMFIGDVHPEAPDSCQDPRLTGTLVV